MAWSDLIHEDRSSLYPLCKLVYGDKQVCIAPGCPLDMSDQIEPPDHERPCDGDCLECLGWQVGLPSIVLTPFTGAHNLFNIGYCGRLVEALSERVFDQGPSCGMVPVTPWVLTMHLTLTLHDHNHH